MVTVPLPGAYDDPQGPAASFLQLVKGPVPIGDPHKVARALITISKAANPPLRLLLGMDAVVVAEGKLNEIRRELEEWKELSLSTVADDVDTTIVEQLKVMFAKEENAWS
ncbi:hypothetical protein OH77DRAFT_1589972 [Trametes cingulata]|nr:hypothetical protein OH77DRAFT_1589972 [Trametes cingulata]